MISRSRPGRLLAVSLLQISLLIGCTIKVGGDLDALPRPPEDTVSSDLVAPDTGRSDIADQEVGVPDVVPTVPEIARPDDVAVHDAETVSDTTEIDAVADVTGPDIEVPEFRFCPWSAEDLPRLTASAHLLGEDFAEAWDGRTAVENVCGGGFPMAEQPSRIWLLDTDTPTRLVLRTRCHDFDCDALVMRDDCIRNNVVSCAATDGDEFDTVELEAGFHMVLLQARGEFRPGEFDLQLALNRDQGAVDLENRCLADETLSLSHLMEEGECVVDEGGAWREMWFEGDTRGGRDRTFLGCRGPGIREDLVGGAPERIWRLLSDFDDQVSKTVSVALETRPPSWQAFLAVTGAPCGARDAVIDCGQTPQPGSLAPEESGRTVVEDITVFPGQDLFVVVDGVGERALSGEHSGPFKLSVRLRIESCTQED